MDSNTDDVSLLTTTKHPNKKLLSNLISWLLYALGLILIIVGIVLIIAVTIESYILKLHEATIGKIKNLKL